MYYLNKFLTKIKENPRVLSSKDVILILGLISTQIKNLKKVAIENQLIRRDGQDYFLTLKGEEYLLQNPLASWTDEKYPLRPQVNIEYLKEEKTPSSLTKAIRNLAKHLIDNQELKAFSLEQALSYDIKNYRNLLNSFENEILNRKRVNLKELFDKYQVQGLTKSLISIALLYTLTQNLDNVAIYEKFQFQLKFNSLMFDRMIACPENFEIQRTEMPDTYLLKDISKIILNKKSYNILEITKGLIALFKNFDKYTLNTQNLSKKTIRFRNVITNAKDPISLFERDIPKVLSNKLLKDCDRDFLDCLKTSLNELKNCSDELIKDLTTFLLTSFQAKSRDELYNRFVVIKEYIGDNELKILLNNIIEKDISEDLWIKRIATFINKSRIPKDWNDEDYSDYKVKTKELALKFFIIEATVGLPDTPLTQKNAMLLKELLKLSKHEQLLILRKFINS